MKTNGCTLGRLMLAVGMGLGGGLCGAAGPASQPAGGANQPRVVIHGGAVMALPNEGFVPQDKKAALAGMQTAKGSVAKAPEVGTFKNVDDLFHARRENGNLKVDPGALAALSGSGRLKVEAGGYGAAAPTTAWTVMLQKMSNMAGGGRTFVSVSRYDWDQTAEGQIWNVQISINGDSLSMIASGIDSRITYRQGMTVWLGMGGGAPAPATDVELEVFGHGPQQGAHGATLAEIEKSDPELVHKYLAPILKRVMGKNLLGPGAADLYGVFAEIPADTEAMKRVKDLLPRLGAEAFETRQAASAELAKLGRPGVLALLRMDLTPLSEEQKARCRAFINAYRQNAMDDPAHLRRDPHFLLDAMEDEDAAVRAAAKSQLQTILGHVVNCDVSAAEEVRSKAMDQLRAEVEKELASKTPATQPSDSINAAEPGAAPAGANQPRTTVLK